ncbi:uncharacterized protein A4U43_C04F15580 [Asparagus officinalis]|uniref:Uncharacterized protein n=1 Tax=Asparagus officinalis TaxID=4686 RepID=A0A5P1F3U3_ASPOF|nr:uncharacterized protein A4U43_C04F15580 [Asparagus officinalis]
MAASLDLPNFEPCDHLEYLMMIKEANRAHEGICKIRAIALPPSPRTDGYSELIGDLFEDVLGSLTSLLSKLKTSSRAECVLIAKLCAQECGDVHASLAMKLWEPLKLNQVYVNDGYAGLDTDEYQQGGDTVQNEPPIASDTSCDAPIILISRRWVSEHLKGLYTSTSHGDGASSNNG